MKKLQKLVAAALLVIMIGGCLPMEKQMETLPKQKQAEKKLPETAESETTPSTPEKNPTTEAVASDDKKDSATEIPSSETEKEIEAEQKKEEELTSEAAQSEESKSEEAVKNTPPEIVNQFSNQAEYNPEVDLDSLSQEPQSWGFKRNKEHLPVTAYYKADLAKYGSYYLGNTEEKVVYLTFDEGYENGFSPAILDTLKEKQVKAAFFITGSYLKHNPELVKRMREEGHLVANHSQTHPDFTTKSDEEVVAEVAQVGDAFKELTGTEMDPFFRFPSGRYTERDLYIIRKMGYRNIFWSMAYKDWEVDNQPGKEYALNHVLENYHPGAIILLHAVSSSNTEALADIITELDAAGYRFGSLYELE